MSMRLSLVQCRAAGPQGSNSAAGRSTVVVYGFCSAHRQREKHQRGSSLSLD